MIDLDRCGRDPERKHDREATQRSSLGPRNTSATAAIAANVAPIAISNDAVPGLVRLSSHAAAISDWGSKCPIPPV